MYRTLAKVLGAVRLAHLVVSSGAPVVRRIRGILGFFKGVTRAPLIAGRRRAFRPWLAWCTGLRRATPTGKCCLRREQSHRSMVLGLEFL